MAQTSTKQSKNLADPFILSLNPSRAVIRCNKTRGMLRLITNHPALAFGSHAFLHFDPRISDIHPLLAGLFEAISCIYKFPTQIASFKEVNSRSNSFEKVPTVTWESCTLFGFVNLWYLRWRKSCSQSFPPAFDGALMAAATKLGTVSHRQCLWGTAWPLENMWRKHVSAEHKKAQKGFPLVEQDWIGPSVVFNLSKEQGMIEDTIMCCDIPVAGFHDLKWAALSLGFLPHNVAPIKHGSTASTGATNHEFLRVSPFKAIKFIGDVICHKKRNFWTTRRPSPSRFWVESSSQMFEVRQSYPTFLLDVLTKTESRISVGFWSISSRGKLLIHGNWNQCQVLHIFTDSDHPVGVEKNCDEAKKRMSIYGRPHWDVARLFGELIHWVHWVHWD